MTHFLRQFRITAPGALFVFLLIILSAYDVKAQSLSFGKERDTVKVSNGKVIEYTLKVSCSGCNATQEFSIEPVGVDIAENSFQMLTQDADMKTGKKGESIEVKVLVRGDEKRIYGKLIIFKLKNKTTATDAEKIFYLYTQKAEEEKPQVRKNNEDRLLFLNAGTFDFSETKVNYVGHVNIFAPNKSLEKKTRWGFNTGIMKLNYWQGDAPDTLNTHELEENVRITPLQTLDSGEQYLRQMNKYSTRVKNTVYSFYAQPLYRLTRNDERAQIYAHGHFELLVNKFQATSKVSALYTDTGIYTGNTDGRDIRLKTISSNESTYNQTFLNGYFGAGFTFNIVPWESGSFFIQPTIGMTTDNPIRVSGLLPARPHLLSNQWNGFYLVRAYYTETLSKDATIVLGTDIRGLFPKFDPAYAAYVGINLSVGAALKLIGINTEKKDDEEKKED